MKLFYFESLRAISGYDKITIEGKIDIGSFVSAAFRKNGSRGRVGGKEYVNYTGWRNSIGANR